MLTQQFRRGVREERVTQRLAPMKPRYMEFHELQIELRHLEREARMAATQKQDTTQKLLQSQQIRPNQYQQAKPTPQPPKQQQKPDSEVLQHLIVTVRQLAEKVEQLSVTHARPRPQRPVQSGSQNVFVCHRCGQKGHIARGCRSQTPLNYQGPRPRGEPSEAQATQAQWLPPLSSTLI